MELNPKYLAVAFCLSWMALLSGGCKEKPLPEPEPLSVMGGVLILNEGNFQGGNASLSYVDAQDSLRVDIFREVHGVPLGDVGQSMLVHDGELWVVVNNSGKVYRLSLPDLSLKCTAEGLVSPRYLQPLPNGRVLVSDLYADAVSMVEAGTCMSVGSIAVGGWTEEMVLANGYVYACQTGTDKLLKIDPSTSMLVDSFAVGRGPVSLLNAGNGQLIGLCDGSLDANPASIFWWDLSADTLLRSLVFADPSAFPADLRLTPDGTQVLWIDQGIWRMGLNDMTLPASPLIAANGRNFYALGIDPANGDIWAADAKDFVRSSEVFVFDANGGFKRSFQAGVNTGQFLFMP